MEEQTTMEVATEETKVLEPDAVIAPIDTIYEVPKTEGPNVTEVECEACTIPEENTETSTDEPATKENNSEEDSESVDMNTVKFIGKSLSEIRDIVTMFEQTWLDTQKEYNIKDEHMKALHTWNEEHKTPIPEDITPEEREKWDSFNGMDSITEEEVERIFGPDSRIIGASHEITVSRIKDAMTEFYTWMGSLREYRKAHDNYVELIETKDEENMQKMKEMAEQLEDGPKKQKVLDAINNYLRNKYLDFLSDPIDEKTKKNILNTMHDQNRLEYWFKRTQTKLRQLNISPRFVLELAQFEKRFMEEKYHKCSNVLLVYFMSKIGYCDVYHSWDKDRSQAICMVFALHNFMLNLWKPEARERVFVNVHMLLDQFIDIMPNKKINVDEKGVSIERIEEPKVITNPITGARQFSTSQITKYNLFEGSSEENPNPESVETETSTEEKTE